MTTTITLDHFADLVTFDPHLARDVEIPMLSALQAQGDVLCVPLAGDFANLATERPNATWAPVRELAVVRGENGGNTHLVVAAFGEARWTTDITSKSGAGLDLGILDVIRPVHLLHPEHGGMGLGVGRWLIRRQREQLAEIRRVQD